MLLDEALDQRCIRIHDLVALRELLDAVVAGRTLGSRPSASRMVSSNLTGSAVSSTTIGMPGSRYSSPTLTPSAVCVSIITP